jgi:hypothetical protein
LGGNLRLETPEDRVGEALRATPYGLARLPNIYLSERYQIFKGLIIKRAVPFLAQPF